MCGYVSDIQKNRPAFSPKQLDLPFGCSVKMTETAPMILNDGIQMLQRHHELWHLFIVLGMACAYAMNFSFVLHS